jgi:hypothetical protein
MKIYGAAISEIDLAERKTIPQGVLVSSRLSAGLAVPRRTTSLDQPPALCVLARSVDALWVGRSFHRHH